MKKMGIYSPPLPTKKKDELGTHSKTKTKTKQVMATAARV